MCCEHKTYSPLTPRVNNPIAQHQPTSATDEIPAAELLDYVRIWVSTFRANETNSEVRAEGLLLSLLARMSEREGLSVCHGRCGL